MRAKLAEPDKQKKDTSVALEKAGVVIPWTLPRERPSEDRLTETTGLIEALGFEAAFVRAEYLRQPNAGQLLSGGLLERFAEDLKSAKGILAVIDANLSPIQQRNLENVLGLKVIDRTGLILEIFGLRAKTKEGVLQVEYARLMYERSRLVRTWTHLERQRGGGGFLGGPGETQLESDKRILDRKLGRLRRDIKDVKRTRSVQRDGRRKKDKPLIALVGYTNVGKSTLFNRLSGANVLAKDMPFATLDSTIRAFELPQLGDARLVDTVGFISDLPPHLIDSFRATLEEILDADLVLHVRDRSGQDEAQQKAEVLKVLDDLTATSGRPLPNIIEVWNKADLMGPDAFSGAFQDPLTGQVVVPISAATGDGVDALLMAVEKALLGNAEPCTIRLAPKDGAARSWIHENLYIEDEQVQADGSSIQQVRITAAQAGRLKSQFGDLFI